MVKSYTKKRQPTLQPNLRKGCPPFSHCRYTKRLWGMVKSWIGIPSIHIQEWMDDLTLEGWWSKMLNEASDNHKALVSLTMLVSWIIWKERNARVFNHKSAPTTTLLNIIKSEVKFWLAGLPRVRSV
jgi:hypothetical protein